MNKPQTHKMLTEFAIQMESLNDETEHEEADNILAKALDEVIHWSYFPGEEWAACDRLLTAYHKVPKWYE